MNSPSLLGNFNKCYYSGKLSGDPVAVTKQTAIDSKFSFDIWFYPTTNDYDLIAIDNFIKVKVVDNAIFIDGCEKNTINELDIIKDAWNNILCVCDSESLIVYIQGYECCRYCVKNLNFPSTLTSYTICNGFTGYIRSIRMYNTSIGDTTKYIYKTKYDAIEMPELLFWLDYSSENPRELVCDGDINIVLPGNFAIKKVSHGFKAGDATYAFVYAPEFNKDNGISLYFKLCLGDSNQEKQILFETADKYTIFLKKANEGFELHYSRGDFVYKLDCNNLHQNKLYAILISIDSVGNAVVHIKSSDGFFSARMDAAFEIAGYMQFGNGYDNSENKWLPFAGYILKAALYNKFFSDQDIGSFFNNDPCVYENDLVALYNFDLGMAVEMCLLSEIKARQDDLVLFEVPNGIEIYDSFSSPSLKKENYPSNDLLEPSIILDTVFEFYKKVYGLVPDNTALTYLKMYAPSWLICHKSAQKILFSHNLNEEDVIDLLMSFDAKSLAYLFSVGKLYSTDDQEEMRSCIAPTIISLSLINDLINVDNSPIKEIFDSLESLKKDYKCNVLNNNKVYDTLKIDNSESESFIEIYNLNTPSLNGSFSLTIWFYPESSSYSLISNVCDLYGFDVYVNDKHIDFIYFCGQERKTVSIDNVNITQNTWNNFSISYDNNTVFFYLHGLEICFLKIGSNDLLHSLLFRIGKGLNGYIRSLNFYSKAMNEDEIIACIHQSDIDSEFSNILTHGSCSINDISHVLSPNSSSIAKAENISFGQLDSGAFSIFARFFPLCRDHGKSVIISNGAFSDENSIILYITNEKYKNVSYLVLKVNNQEFYFSEISIYNDCWNDALVIFANDSMPCLYLNGELLKCSSGETVACNDEYSNEIIIGSCLQDTYPFNGYISSVAIFNRSLSEKEAFAFHNGSSLLYTDGLVAYYDFSSGIPSELISRSRIVGIDECLKITACTNDETEELPWHDIEKENPVINKRILLERDVILHLFSVYLEKAYDIKFDEKSLNTLKLHGSFGVPYEGAISDLIYSTKTASTDVVNALKALTPDFFNWFLEDAWLLEGGNTQPINKILRTRIISIVASVDNMVETGLINDIVTIIDEIKKNIEYVPEINIASLTFQHAPDDVTKSATYCRNVDNAINGAEWVKDRDYINPILYITKTLETVDVVVDISVVSKNIPKNNLVKISMIDANNEIFAEPATVEVKLEPDQSNYTIRLSSKHKMNKNNISCYNGEFHFVYCYYENDEKIRENISIASDFVFKIYSIPEMPNNPISIYKGNEDYYPIIELIDIILTTTQNYISDENPIKDVMQRLYNNPYLKFVPTEAGASNDMEKFSEVYHELVSEDDPAIRLETDVIFFKVNEFINTFRTASAEDGRLCVDSEVYALLLMYGFCLMGKDSVISHIIPFTDDNDNCENFKTNSLLSAGSDDASVFDLAYQAVVESGGLIYDASLRINTTEFLTELSFEKDEYNEEEGYVNKVFVSETYAMPGGITNDVSIKGMVCQITPVKN